MGKVNIQDISLIPLKKINLKGGGVMHAIKHSELTFKGFGEAYFSQINFTEIKAWKLHLRMTMNLVVPVGEVQFVFIDSFGETRIETIGEKNYSRLTVPPGLWFGFKGVSKKQSLILNIANIEHSPEEVKRKEIDAFNFNWEDIRK